MSKVKRELEVLFREAALVGSSHASQLADRALAIVGKTDGLQEKGEQIAELDEELSALGRALHNALSPGMVPYRLADRVAQLVSQRDEARAEAGRFEAELNEERTGLSG